MARDILRILIYDQINNRYTSFISYEIEHLIIPAIFIHKSCAYSSDIIETFRLTFILSCLGLLNQTNK